MMTKWRIPEGKKLQETKVSERIKELHMTSERMGAIKAHLTRNERLEAELQVEADRLAKVRQCSEDMTKDWTDSIQHQHAVRQAELEARLHQQNDQNLVKFLTVKKEQEAERDMYVSEVRQKMLQRQDFPKTLGSAYLFSEVLHEREKQKDFAKILRDQKEKLIKEEVAVMLEDVEKFKEEQTEKKKMLFKKNKAYAADLMKQVVAVKTAIKQQREDKIEEELSDQVRAKHEAGRIEDARLKRVAEGRRQLRESVEFFLTTQEQERAKIKMDDRNREVMTQIMEKSKDRIRILLKQKSKEAQEKRIAKGLSTYDNSMQLKREAEMQLIYDKGMAKFNQEDQERQEEQREKEIRFRQERIDIQNEAMEKKEADRKRSEEVERWNVLNRFKRVDEDKQFHQRLKKKADDMRATLLNDFRSEMKLKTERLAIDAQAEARAIRKKNEQDDKNYMEYAKQVKDLAIENGYNTVPIDKVVKTYSRDVIGEKSLTRCEKLHKETCANKAHAVTKPGKRTHCPLSDPTIQHKKQAEKKRNLK